MPAPSLPTIGGSTGTWGDELNTWLANVKDTFNVKDQGVTGDGSTDDTSMLGTVTRGVPSTGGQVLMPPTSNGYVVSRSLAGVATSGGVVLQPNTRLEGQNTKIVLADNTNMIKAWGTVATSYATITADTTTGSTTLTVNSSSGYTAGDTVFVQLGQAAYDAVEPDFWLFAKAASVPDGTHITLDRPVGYAMTAAGVATAAHKSVRKVDPMMENVVVDGFNLVNPMTGSANAEEGLYFQFARNCQVKNLQGSNTGAGLVATEWCDNITIDNAHVETSSKQGQASKGRGFSFAHSRNIHVLNASLKDCEGTFVSAEGRSEAIRFDNLILDNGNTSRVNTDALITIIGASKATFGDVWLLGTKAPLITFGGSTGNDYTIQNLYAYTSGTPTIPDLGRILGNLYVNGTLYSEIRTWRQVVPLYPNGDTITSATFPKGLCRKLRIYASSTTGLIRLYTSSSFGIGGRMDTYLVAGQTVDIPVSGMDDGTTYPFNASTTKTLVTNTTGGGYPVGGYLIVEMEYYVDPTVTGPISQAGGLEVGNSVLGTGMSVSSGTAAPGATTTGLFYLRQDGGGAGATHIYFNNAGTWIGVA